ncbi:MAG: hypothetical protein ACE5OZ_18310 [Candidatus Heimdallarchaeota archaeon]
MHNSSSDFFLLQEGEDSLLTDSWLNSSLEKADWRYQLLTRVIQYALKHFTSFQPLGTDYLVRLAHPGEKEELRIFLEAVRHLCLARPRMVQESPAKDLYVLRL